MTKTKVEHPPVAEVVRKYEKRFGRHKGIYSLQDPKAEWIAFFCDMLRDLRMSFPEQEGFVPMRLIIFGTSVADEQFSKLLTYELHDAEKNNRKEMHNRKKHIPACVLIVMQRDHNVPVEPSSL